MNIFDTIFYQPLLKTLLFLYDLQPAGLGGAVVILTFVIKVLLFPLNRKSLKSQKALLKLQPKLKEIQKKFKDDKETQARATMKLYQEAGINPFASVLLLVIQMPVLIALYRVFLRAPSREGIDPYLLGLNLSAPNTLMALAGALFLFVQMKLTSPGKAQPDKKSGSEFQAMLQKQMQYFFPVFIFFVLIKVPSAIALYLIVSGALSIVEKYLVEGELF